MQLVCRASGQISVGPEKAFQEGNLVTCKNDEIIWIISPQLNKVNSVAKSEGRMSTKYNTGLPILGVHSLILENGKLKYFFPFKKFLKNVIFVLSITT